MIAMSINKVEVMFLEIGNKWFDIFRVKAFIDDIGIDPAEIYIDDDINLLKAMIQEGIIESNSKLDGVMVGDNYQGFCDIVINLYIPTYDHMNEICNNLERNTLCK